MLQKTFSIYSEDLNDVQLFIETGNNHIACWCKKANDDQLRAFEFFQCDAYTAESFEELIDNTKLYSRLLTMPVVNTFFIWNTNDVLCLPKEKTEPAFLKQNFNLFTGCSDDATIYSKPTEHCLVAWQVKDTLQNAAAQCFPSAVFMHQYNALFPSLQAAEESIVYLFLYPQYFTLVAFKQNKLQLSQTKKYHKPEDVLYFILNVYKQYEIEKNTVVCCGGFIDEKSNLYDVLFQYLEGFQLMKAEETRFATNEFTQYATHYFMPYINYVV